MSMSSKSRVIRVFLSSTFKDFVEERDLLVKKVFPELRRLCRERQVDLVDIDLRWGITEEEIEQGKVLPICLEEIKRARPYFICFLGERYGWVPEESEYDLALIAREPWLEEHRGGKSVTEMEVLHGVLNNPKMTNRAFFYLRDPKYSHANGEDYAAESPKHAEKLKRLKELVRASKFPLVENYTDPETLAEKVRNDLRALIEEEYPEEDVPDALTLERMRHEAYGAARRKFYLGGDENFDALDSALLDGQDPSHPILVWGEPGSGKSALLSNWMAHWRIKHPDDYIIFRSMNRDFQYADNPFALAATIAAELIRELDDITDDAAMHWSDWASLAGIEYSDIHFEKFTGVIDKIVRAAGADERAFHETLILLEKFRRIEAEGKSFHPSLIVEALLAGLQSFREFYPDLDNELESKEVSKKIVILDEVSNPAMLNFLPRHQFAEVRFVISSSSEKVKNLWQKWPEDSLNSEMNAHLDPSTKADANLLSMKKMKMSARQIREFVNEKFQSYGKTLPNKALEAIATAPFACNPLWLTVLTEELRYFGDEWVNGVQRDVSDHLTTLLSSPPEKKEKGNEDTEATIDDVALHILDRLEKEIEGAQDSLCVIGLVIRYSRFIMRDELLELAPISPMGLSWLELALDEEWSSGLIRLNNQSFRRAIEQREMVLEEERRIHLRIARLLSSRGDSLDTLGRACRHWEVVFFSGKLVAFDPIDRNKRSDFPVDEQNDYDLFCERASVFSILFWGRAKDLGTISEEYYFEVLTSLGIEL